MKLKKSSLEVSGERKNCSNQIQLHILIHCKYHEEKIATSLLKIDLAYSSCADTDFFLMNFCSSLKKYLICYLHREKINSGWFAGLNLKAK